MIKKEPWTKVQIGKEAFKEIRRQSLLSVGPLTKEDPLRVLQISQKK